MHIKSEYINTLVKVLNNLRRICPSLEHIKLDKRGAEAFPDLLEV
jgi:hypothetical protein